MGSNPTRGTKNSLKRKEWAKSLFGKGLKNQAQAVELQIQEPTAKSQEPNYTHSRGEKDIIPVREAGVGGASPPEGTRKKSFETEDLRRCLVTVAPVAQWIEPPASNR